MKQQVSAPVEQSHVPQLSNQISKRRKHKKRAKKRSKPNQTLPNNLQTTIDHLPPPVQLSPPPKPSQTPNKNCSNKSAAWKRNQKRKERRKAAKKQKREKCLTLPCPAENTTKDDEVKCKNCLNATADQGASTIQTPRPSHKVLPQLCEELNMQPLTRVTGLKALFKDHGNATQTPTDHFDDIFNGGPLIHVNM